MFQKHRLRYYCWVYSSKTLISAPTICQALVSAKQAEGPSPVSETDEKPEITDLPLTFIYLFTARWNSSCFIDFPKDESLRIQWWLLWVVYVRPACFAFCLLPDHLETPPLLIFFNSKIFIEHLYMPSPVLNIWYSGQEIRQSPSFQGASLYF